MAVLTEYKYTVYVQKLMVYKSKNQLDQHNLYNISLEQLTST